VCIIVGYFYTIIGYLYIILGYLYTSFVLLEPVGMYQYDPINYNKLLAYRVIGTAEHVGICQCQV
jgi:hypothetical protein